MSARFTSLAQSHSWTELKINLGKRREREQNNNSNNSNNSNNKKTTLEKNSDTALRFVIPEMARFSVPVSAFIFLGDQIGHLLFLQTIPQFERKEEGERERERRGWVGWRKGVMTPFWFLRRSGRIGANQRCSTLVTWPLLLLWLLWLLFLLRSGETCECWRWRTPRRVSCTWK